MHIFRKVWLGRKGYYDCYPAEKLIDFMKSSGVDKAILISYEGKDILPDLGGDPTKIDVDKEYYIQAYEKYLGDFIWFTDGIDPRGKDWMKEVENDIQRGAKGIKMFPAYYATLPSDFRYNELYRKCADLELPVIMAFERWNDPNLEACVKDYNEFLRKFEPVAKRFENVDFLLTHWGCFSWGENYPASLRPPFPGLQSFIRLLNRYDNLYTDIAAITFLSGGANKEGYPFPTAIRMIEELIRGVGVEKVMYGTDWPWTDNVCTYRQTVTMIKHHANFLNDKEKQMLLGENASKFLGLY